MLFNTGAPETVLFPDIAIKLDLLDPDTPILLTRVGGIGGTVPALRTIIDSMRVGQFKNNFVPVTVLLEGLPEGYNGIIGLDFISDYKVRIDPKDEVVVFEEIAHDKQRYGGHHEDGWRRYFIEFKWHRSEWKRWRDSLDKLPERNAMLYHSKKQKIKLYQEIADKFYGESELLLGQLHRYASTHAVPIHWRRAQH